MVFPRRPLVARPVSRLAGAFAVAAWVLAAAGCAAAGQGRGADGGSGDGGACPPPAGAHLVAAASASLADVQAAVDAASPGDVVEVPAGTATWASALQMPGDLELRGAGAGRTVVQNARTDWLEATIDVAATAGARFRIDGFTFQGTAPAGTPNNADALFVSGSTTAFRIDHDTFETGGAHSIYLRGDLYGVIDHDTFDSPSREVISIFDKGTGDDAWSKPLDLGSARAVYAEDDTFDFETVGDHAITAVNGGRYVFRHDQVHSAAALNSSQVDAHGNFFVDRSTRSFEIYDNALSSGGSYQGMYLRGGTGVVFDNTFTGTYTRPIILTQYRAFELKQGDTAGPCGFSSCTHPSPDQIEDTWFWGNTYQGQAANPWVDDRGAVRTVIQEGRDYFLAQRPGYTPYTYPHPLTVGCW